MSEEFRCCDTCRNVNACAIKAVCRKERWKAEQPTVISIDQQIKCVRRELKLRETVYPRLIARGKLKPHEAEWQLEAMRAVLGTLEQVELQRGMP